MSLHTKTIHSCYNCGTICSDSGIYKWCPACKSVPLCTACNFDDEDFTCPQCFLPAENKVEVKCEKEKINGSRRLGDTEKSEM